MGRSPCCSKEGLNRGAWTKTEDIILCEYIRIHGDGGWRTLPKKAGLKRCGKSCRLRWLNYLRPDIKRGGISPDEEELIIRLHRLLGNRWSLIAGRLPGRTDNEIKNYWNTHLCKKMPLMNQSQPKGSKQNLETRSKDPSPLQNHVSETSPIKITMAVKHSEIVTPKGCSNSVNSAHGFQFCNVKETTNFSMSWRDLLVNNSITHHVSEPFSSEMEGVNVVEEEVRNSTCSMSNLGDEESPHFDHFAGVTATLAESLLDLNELSYPDWNLLFSSATCSTDSAIEEFYMGAAAETNEFEDMCYDQSKNMQRDGSFTVADDQGMEKLYDNMQQGKLHYL